MAKINNFHILGLVTLALILDCFLGSPAPEGVSLAIGLPGAAAIAGGSALLSDLFRGKGRTQRQVALEPSETSEARKILLDIAKTGKFGDLEFGGDLEGFTPGEDLGFSLGNFDVTDIEGIGLGGIERLLDPNAPRADLFGITEAALSDIIGGEGFDPSDSFSPFKSRVEREITERSDDLKRQAGFAGDLFSTNTVEQLGDVQARGSEALASELARLTDAERNRRMQAIPLALQQAGSEGQLDLSRLLSGVEGAMKFGGLERSLEDTQALREREEGLRQRGEVATDVARKRGEEFSVIDILTTILGSQTPFGIPEITVPGQNPFQGVFDAAGQFGGQLVNREMMKDILKT